MEKAKSYNVTQNKRDFYHQKLMENILHNLSDTPLVLKGGTALYLCYGLNRFSEDLDFDSSKKLNITNRIKNVIPQEIILDGINVKKDTNTVSRFIVNYQVKDTESRDSLKIEISYRTPVPENKIKTVNGIKCADIDVIIDNKLKAAFDGENPRTKGRDLFDLHFLAMNYSDKFSQDPDKLVSAYYDDVKDDPLLHEIMDLEKLALELSEKAELILKQSTL